MAAPCSEVLNLTSDSPYVCAYGLRAPRAAETSRSRRRDRLVAAIVPGEACDYIRPPDPHTEEGPKPGPTIPWRSALARSRSFRNSIEVGIGGTYPMRGYRGGGLTQRKVWLLTG